MPFGMDAEWSMGHATVSGRGRKAGGEKRARRSAGQPSGAMSDRGSTGRSRLQHGAGNSATGAQQRRVWSTLRMSRAERCGNAMASPKSPNGFQALSKISPPSIGKTATGTPHGDAGCSKAPTSGPDVSTAATGWRPCSGQRHGSRFEESEPERLVDREWLPW